MRTAICQPIDLIVMYLPVSCCGVAERKKYPRRPRTVIRNTCMQVTETYRLKIRYLSRVRYSYISHSTYTAYRTQ